MSDTARTLGTWVKSCQFSPGLPHSLAKQDHSKIPLVLRTVAVVHQMSFLARKPGPQREALCPGPPWAVPEALQTPPHPRAPLYMQRQQGLGRVLLKPGAIEGQVADLLALGIEQEGAHRWRRHVRPWRGAHGGWSDRGYTWPWESRRGREKHRQAGRG